MTDKTLTRRGFIGATAAAIPVAAALASRTAVAQDELPHLDLDDPVAKALSYVHDVDAVDTSTLPGFKEGSDCANCIQIQADSGTWRPCTAFPGKAVNEKGWCAAWAPMPG